MSWLTSLFTGSKSIDKGIDMVSSGLDALVFTDEEKSVANQKILDWKLKWIAATGPQSVARRVIAYIITGLWCYLVILATHLYLFGYKEQSKFVFDVLADIVTNPFLMVGAFYYAAHVVRSNKN